MEKQEFSILVKAMKAVWTDPKFIPDNDAINVWFGMLSDIPYQLASVAIRQYMSESKFPPTIAEIRNKVADIALPETLDSGAAWMAVKKAVGRYGYGRPQEALASLDPLTREAAERFGFRDLCDMKTDDNGIARAQFMKIYDQIRNRRQQDAVLQIGTKEEIKRLRKKTAERLEAKK